MCPFRTAPERSDRRALVEQTSKPLMKFSRAARSFKTGRLRFLVQTGRTPGNPPTPAIRGNPMALAIRAWCSKIRLERRGFCSSVLFHQRKKINGIAVRLSVLDNPDETRTDRQLSLDITTEALVAGVKIPGGACAIPR